jgi:uncharacterized protein (TIGR03083 family)
MAEIGSIYAEGRARLTDLVASAEAEQHTMPVPGCPQWVVRDVIAHVTGVCADVLSGNVGGVATEAWTAAQVAERKDRTVGEILAEWSEIAPQVEAMAQHFPGRIAEQWVLDLTTHEHDVRGALARPGARDSAGVAIGLDFAATMGLAASIAERGLPPLRVKAAEQQWVVGEGEPTAELGGMPFDLFRAMTGRRSAAQIRGFTWTGDPDVFLPAFEFGPFTTPPTELVE